MTNLTDTTPTKEEVLVWFRQIVREEVRRALSELTPEERRALREDE